MDRFGILVLMFLIVGLVSGGVVEKDVLDAFEGGQSEVGVIVEGDVGGGSDFGIMSGEGEKVGMVVSEDELEDLLEGDVSVRMNYPLRVFVQDSVGIIEADSAWGLEYAGVNLTGGSQSICILDTGINNSHPDFAGKILAEKCFCSVTDLGGGGCCPDTTAEDNSATDDNGHGTHVAGIAGASGGLVGVANNVSFVIVKIMNASGSGWAVDLEDGIDWCVANREAYNISVISASLGDENTGYSSATQSTCDSRSSALTSSINAAVALNISVTFASGNENRNNGISWPSCVSSATPVGAVNKNDSLAVYGNRGDLLKLLGVGGNASIRINSTSYLGGYTLKYGTSMATPMVSGAIAILNQFLSLTGRAMSPSEIEDVLYDTGVTLSELGNNYSRISVYDALLSLDNVAPNVSLVYPLDNHVNISVNQSLFCNVSDWQLANVSLQVWNSSGGLYYNESSNLTGVLNGTGFDLVNLSRGDYSWNCLATDSLGNFDSSSANFSFTIGEILVSLDSPDNASYTNESLTNFSCSSFAIDAYSLSNVSFYLWNSSGGLIFNETSNISGVENVSVFNYSFSEDGVYFWKCVAYNNNSDMGDVSNFSVNYDGSVPGISGLSVDASTVSAVISWTTNESCNTSVHVSGGSWSNSSDYVSSHSVSVSSLSSSTPYSYDVLSCDLGGNCVVDSGVFTTDAIPSSGSSSSSGGGGGGSRIVNVNSENFKAGVSERLRVGDKLNFALASGSHSLQVSRVRDDSADVLIKSDPVLLTFYVGDEVLLNLSSDEYYDLFVRLNDVSNGRANVTIRKVFEIIEVDDGVGVIELNESDDGRDEMFHTMDDERGFPWGSVVFIVVIFVLVWLAFWVLLRDEGEIKKFSKRELRQKRKAHKKKAKRLEKEIGKKLKSFGLKV